MRGVALIVIILACGSSNAAPPQIPNDARAVYEESSDLPDGLALTTTMTVLETMSGIDDGAPAIDLITRGMGLTPENAKDLLDKLLLASETYTKDRAALFEKKLCPATGEVPVGDEVFERLEYLDDMQEYQGSALLLDLKGQLSEENFARLKQWLQSRKTSVTYVKPNYRGEFQRASRNPDAGREEICEKLGLLKRTEAKK